MKVWEWLRWVSLFLILFLFSLHFWMVKNALEDMRTQINALPPTNSYCGVMVVQREVIDPNELQGFAITGGAIKAFEHEITVDHLRIEVLEPNDIEGLY